MGSAITFSDKIASKTCQNLQDLGGSGQLQLLHPLCASAAGNSSCNNSGGNHSHDHPNHVDVNYCDSYSDCDGDEEDLLEGTETQFPCFSREIEKTRFEADEEESSSTDEEGEEVGINTEEIRPQPLSQPRGRASILLTKLSKCVMGRRCLCESIKPILKLSQLLGIIPLNLKHERNSEGKQKAGSCELTFRWKSLSTFLNTSFLFFFLLISPIAHSEIRGRMIIVFSGTDLYAFSLQMVAMVLETTVLLSVGRLCQAKFSRGWSSLNEVFHAICDSADDLQQIKLASYITAVIIMVEGVFFFIFMYFTSHRAIGLYQSCTALLIGTFVISLTLIIPYIMSTLFLFICLLIRSHFLKISEMLQTVVSKHNHSSSPKNLSSKIDALRVLHEQLCTTVNYFEDFFGFQLLLTLCTCCFTVTVGACVIHDTSSPEGKELTAAWGMQLYCAAIFILVILISGQLVSNSAASPASILNAIPLTELDDRSQLQVQCFLNKISAFPTTMSAVKITTISTTFLASAATNITTYLLVLMQFKLSVENRFDDDVENLTMPVGGFEIDPSTEPIFYNVTSSLAFLTESI